MGNFSVWHWLVLLIFGGIGWAIYRSTHPKITRPTYSSTVTHVNQMFCHQCGTNNNQDSKFCASCGTLLAQPVVPPVRQEKPTSSAPSPTYAGFWFRVLALVIDGVLCQIIAVIVVLPLAFVLGLSMAGTSSSSEIEAVGSGLGFFIGILVQWLWFTIPESSKWQATVGKKMLGLKVTDENGERIGFGKANGRYWSKILSGLILGIGFIMVAFTEKKQGLHDKIAGTLVVKTNA